MGWPGLLVVIRCNYTPVCQYVKRAREEWEWDGQLNRPFNGHSMGLPWRCIFDRLDVYCIDGAVVHSGERLICIQEVRGSNPLGSTNK
jgi:hypothetical protein